jgi:hypothetical protein
MIPSRAPRIGFLILLSLLMIACAIFQPSDQISPMQSTSDVLTDQLNDSQPDQEISTPFPSAPFTDQTQVSPEILSTVSAFQNALEFIDQYGGSTNVVDAQGKYAYLGQGPRMVVLDISNPASPTRIGESELLPGLVMGLAVEGSYAYVTTAFSGLNIFDIAQPANPILVSQVAPENPGCGPLVVEDGIAYVACNPSGLFVVDVYDPLSPKILSSDSIRGTMISIAVLNNFVYLVDVSKGIVIVDSSDPGNPQQVGFFEDKSIPSLGSAFTQAINSCQGDLCLAVANHGFVILDLTDPINPTIKASITQFWPSGILSRGQFAFLVDDLEGVRIFDISNPSQPQQVGLMPTAVGGFEFTVQELTERGISIADDFLYIPDQAFGLTTVDLRNPTQPVRVGQYMTPVPDWMMSINVVGNYAYAVSRYAGLRVLDVTDTENIAETYYDDERKFLTSQVPLAVDVIGNYAFIADGNYPLHTYDISNPSQPVEVGVVDGGPAWDGAFDLAITGDIAYLSGSAGNDSLFPGNGLWVIDIKDPTRLKPINFLDLPNEKWSLSIHNSVLYALDGSQDRKDLEPLSLRIIDISNPSQPKVYKSLPLPALIPLSPSGVQVSGDWLYLGLGMNGLKMFDIRDPRNPIETPITSTSWLSPYVHKLAIQGTTLILNGNMAYDISDPVSPNLIGIAYEAQDAWNADISGDVVYIVTKFTGIYVYRMKPVP